MKCNLKLTSEINIHQHYSEDSELNSGIYSFDVNDNLEPVKRLDRFSIGIHPWFAKCSSKDKDLSIVAKFAKKMNCVAIGECGLDRLRGESLNFQLEIFREQINIANSANKPIIIHCVKAFPELISLKKEFSKITQWIVHGFNGNKQIANELIKHHISISFGVQLLTSQKLQNIYQSLPKEYRYLETDASNIPFNEIVKEISLYF